LELAVTEHSTPVGSVTLAEIAHGNAMVRYWLLPEARGRGVATRAVRLLAGWAFSTLGLGRLAAFIEFENRASAAVLERCGFVEEGRLRRHLTSRDGNASTACSSGSYRKSSALEGREDGVKRPGLAHEDVRTYVRVEMAGYYRGEADGDARDKASVTAHGSPRRPGERETAAPDAQRAQGWSCPHCAVENLCAERGAGDVVECDYCGRAFALADGGGADEFLTR